MSAKLLADLLGDLSCEVMGDRQARITGIAYHSRKVELGNLFVAIDGFASSGRNYVDEALEQGARAIASREESSRVQEFKSSREGRRPGVTYVRTDNPRRFLAQVAHRFYDFPGRTMKLIGVTGTNGKTTVTYLIRMILEAAGERSGLIGTIRHYDGENWIKAANTTPESLDLARMLATMRNTGISYCVAEVSSHAIVLERVAELDFAVGVFTNLTQDHLDFHKTLDEYKAAKLRFFSTLKPGSWVVYNADDPAGPEVKAATGATALSFGLSAGTVVRAEVITMTDKGTSLRLTVENEPATINTRLIGKHNVYNVMAAAGAAHCLGIPLGTIQQGIQKLKSVPGRLERVENRAGIPVFVDYAHTPDALANLIDTARSLKGTSLPRGPGELIAPAQSSGRIIVVFGCGGNRDKVKRPLMGKIATERADLVIVTSDNPRDEDPEAIISDIQQGMVKDNFEVIPNRYAAIKRALNVARPSDIVLIAGKGHEDYQIIGETRRHFDDRETVKAILG